MHPTLGDFFRVLSLRDKYHLKADSLNEMFALSASGAPSLALDIGCGSEPKNPFNAARLVGLDLKADPQKNIVEGDLSSGQLPFESEEFDFVSAYDVLEHIPRVSRDASGVTFPFVALMSEIHRILKSQGIFFSSTPCFPFKEAFQDPTHVNIMTEDTLRDYFSNDCWAKIYGFSGSFGFTWSGWLNKKHCVFLKKI